MPWEEMWGKAANGFGEARAVGFRSIIRVEDLALK